jgi:thiamine-phosphate pyrophosphorylase
MSIEIAKIHLITQENESISHLQSIENGLKGGAKWIQLRVKNKEIAAIEKIALSAKEMCSEFNAQLIINDEIEICKKLDLDGVHLGLTDTDTGEARLFLGKNKIIGGTANSFADVLHHHKRQVNYIGIGPYRFTNTKENLSPILGIEGYKNILSEMKKNNIETPLIAIGGIQTEDITALFSIGMSGIALASLVNLAPKPIKKMMEVIELTS